MPGPGGINAARTVSTAVPDGYTLGLVTNATAISVASFNKLPFDPVKDFDMISGLGQFNLLFAVDANSKYKTLGDFIADAKANPGKLNIGSIVVGSTQDLGAELFKSSADVNVQIVTFKNSPDVVVSLLRNDVQMLVDFPPGVLKARSRPASCGCSPARGRRASPTCRMCRQSRKPASRVTW